MKIIKRNGSEATFDIVKIIAAVTKANNVVPEDERLTPMQIRRIAESVENNCLSMNRALSVEEIQDLVENQIMAHGAFEVAKNYITYRYTRTLVRKSNTTDEKILSLIESNNEEVKQENSNKNPTVNAVQRDYMAGEVSKDLTARVLLPQDIVDAHNEGIIHFHDADYFAQHMHNCDLVNLEDMLQNGTVISGTLIEKPHSFSTACNIATQIIAQIASNQYGGQSLSLTHLAPFVDISRQKIRRSVLEEIKSFGVQPSEETITNVVETRLRDEIRRGVQTIQYQVVTLMTTNGQAPFITVFMYLGEARTEQERKDLAIIIEETLRQRIEGVKNEKGVWITPAFPKLIYVLEEDNITEDSPYWELTKLAARCTAKRMVPDYISEKKMRELKLSKGETPGHGDVYTCMGCRSFLTPDRSGTGWNNVANAGNYEPGKPKYYGRFNQGVVTINLPRIAYLAKDEADFFVRLDRMMDLAARSLKIKRTTVEKLLEEGLYPYTKRYLGGFDNHFSTIGLVGMNEAGPNANWLRKDLTHEETQNFAVRVLKHMRERLSDYQELYGDLYNLEATPAESTAYRLAKHDKARYPDIITAHEGGTPYYTNSSHLPVGYTEDVFAALDVQDKLQTLYTSGTVFHTFLGEKLPSWQSAAALVRKIAENYELPYYTLSPTYSICTEHGYLKGEQKTCPICGKATEVYSRITGYYRPVQNWNDGKSQEFLDRKTYQVGGAQEDCPKRREDKAAGKPAGGYYLYTTATCPNCHIIKPILEKAGIPFVERDAEQYLQEVTALGLTHAPSLVVQANPPIIYAGVARIKEFLEQA